MLPSPSPRPWALPTEPFSYKWGHPKWGRATWQYFSQPASAKALVSVASRQVKQTLSGLGRHPWGPSCRLPLCFMFVLHRRHVQTAFSGFSRKSIPVRQPKSVCPLPALLLLGRVRLKLHSWPLSLSAVAFSSHWAENWKDS